VTTLNSKDFAAYYTLFM